MADQKQVEKLLKGEKAWNSWRIKNPVITSPDLIGADLSGANLTMVNLIGANLTKADLSGANLIGAALSRANLIGADLIGADLTTASLIWADLAMANLTMASLRWADLSCADLSRANLSGANLTKANLTRDSFGETILGDTDLTDAKGLESGWHKGPSTIDHRTLMRSGNLPLTFLRGCGLPNRLIDYLPSLLKQAIEFYSCFISYSSKDDKFTQRLYADLQNNDVRCWFAPKNLKIGQRVRSTIDEAIRFRDKLILIFSKNSIESDWVEHEVHEAREEEKKRRTIVLFPIRIDDAVMKTEFGWAKQIRQADKDGRHIGDFRKWKNHDAYQKSLDRLLRDLKVTPRD